MNRWSLVLFIGLTAGGTSFVFASSTGSSSVQTTEWSAPRWLLPDFLELADTDPARLLRISEKLFHENRLRMSSVDSVLAFEWQARLAALSALTSLFDRERMGTRASLSLQARARAVMTRALTKDPSLIVRDGAVESIRRLVRMNPKECHVWKAPLEQAFLDANNHIEGEGLFIRETILTVLREASLGLTRRVRLAAARDRNPGVRDRLKLWSTAAYERAR